MNLSNLKPAKDFALQFGVSGIYCITVNNKIYIGSAKNLKDRKHTHKKKLNAGKHPNKHLQAAYSKYGDFSFNILEFCNIIDLLGYEQRWIDWTDACNKNKGYNKRKIVNSNLGLKHSEESKQKIRLANLGHHRCLGKKLTEEHKDKVSKALKGRKHSPEHIERRIIYKRKLEKWPHGYICKCKPCMKKKSEEIMKRRKQKLLDAGIFQYEFI